MWKLFPQVLGIDNTYKTNRFNMHLFQTVGVTDYKSVANFNFDLFDMGKEDGYAWLCQQMKKAMGEIEAPEP